MQGEKSLKIIFVGSVSSGKSMLVNILALQMDLTKVPYRPTKTVRILETDVKEIISGSSIIPKNVDVQLWDLGGDKHNQQYWTSALYSADGVVVVYNADRPSQEKELETIFYYFNQRPENAILKPVHESRFLVIANQQRPTDRSKFIPKSGLPSSMSGRFKEIQLNDPGNDAQRLQKEFQIFINDIYKEIPTVRKL